MASVIKGLTFIVADPVKTTPFIKPRITGLAFNVVPRTLTVRAVLWNGAAYVPLAGIAVDAIFETQTNRIVTKANGLVVLDFEENYLEAKLVSVPAGYQILDTHFKMQTVARNFATYVFYPVEMNLAALHYTQI